MLRTRRISHVTLTSPDVDRLVDYQVNVLGLSLEARDGGTAYLKTAMGQLALVVEQGDVAGCTGVSFQLDPASSLDEIGKALAAGGVRAERRSDGLPGVAESLSFLDPKGTRVDVFGTAAFLAENTTPKGFVPLKLGHVAFKTPEIDAAVDFYGTVLGFRVSDWRGDFFVWMRCGPDHHTANFVRGDRVKMHHVAFELADRAEILRACDFLGRNKYPVIWGPGRHVIGDNVFTYHRDPDGNIIELYAELARMDSEDLGYFVPRPWRDSHPYDPATWGDGTLMNLWGAGPPPGFGD